MEINIMYNMLLSDLDGTLLDDSKQISNDNYTAIQALIHNNKYFVICSGRSNMSLNHINKQLNINIKGCYTIAYNGGLIYKSDTGEVILAHFMPIEFIKSIISFCKSYSSNIVIYKEEKLICENLTEIIARYAKNSFLKPVVVNFDDIIDNKINKILVIEDNSILKKLENDFISDNRFTNINCFFSSDSLLEFNPPNVDKGTAIKELADYLNININNVAAIGDSYNDIPMLKAAGLSIAVANAEDEVKAVAKYITQNDNNSSAVAEVINIFF
jgi:hypothetical protein